MKQTTRTDFEAFTNVSFENIFLKNTMEEYLLPGKIMNIYQPMPF